MKKGSPMCGLVLAAFILFAPADVFADGDGSRRGKSSTGMRQIIPSYNRLWGVYPP
jgi:hypothetical protein